MVRAVWIGRVLWGKSLITFHLLNLRLHKINAPLVCRTASPYFVSPLSILSSHCWTTELVVFAPRNAMFQMISWLHNISARFVFFFFFFSSFIVCIDDDCVVFWTLFKHISYIYIYNDAICIYAKCSAKVRALERANEWANKHMNVLNTIERNI